MRGNHGFYFEQRCRGISGEVEHEVLGVGGAKPRRGLGRVMERQGLALS